MSSFVFEERPYQTEAVAQVLAEFENGRESVLLESPVGSGKTVMGLMIIQKLQKNYNGQLRVNWVASSGVPVVPLVKVGAVVAFASTAAATTKLTVLIVS